MKKGILYGIFLFVIGASMIVTYFTTKQTSYAYPKEEKYQVTFNYILEDNKEENNEIGYFQVLDENYKVLKTFDLKINDSITIDTLNKDRYILRQMKTPLKYDAISDFYFDVIKESNIVNLITKTSINPKLGVMLLDIQTNKILSDGEFHLMDLNENIISSCTTISGYCMMNDIPSGEYVLENVLAPDGYILTENTKVVINEEIKINYLDIYTNPTKITINLYDKMTEYLISGATFRLYDSNSNELFLVKDNNYEIKGLKEGIYYLEESTVPLGYSNNNQKYKFQIKNDSKDTQLNIYYKRVENNFLTSNMFYLFGCLIFISGVGLLTIIYHKNKVKNNGHTKNR